MTDTKERKGEFSLRVYDGPQYLDGGQAVGDLKLPDGSVAFFTSEEAGRKIFEALTAGTISTWRADSAINKVLQGKPEEVCPKDAIAACVAATQVLIGEMVPELSRDFKTSRAPFPQERAIQVIQDLFDVAEDEV